MIFVSPLFKSNTLITGIYSSSSCVIQVILVSSRNYLLVWSHYFLEFTVLWAVNSPDVHSPQNTSFFNGYLVSCF